MQDPLASWATILSAIATFIIAILTYKSISIAKRSLNLMEMKERRWNPDLELYLGDTFIKRDENLNIRIYAVNIKITNKSDSTNSIRELILSIKFRRASKITSNILIPSVGENIEKFSKLIDKDSSNILSIPKIINGHEVVDGWAIFKIDYDFIKGTDIDYYNLKITDTYGHELSREVGIFAQ
jgi:hypothetical protein